jgi:hypothetical protein
VTTPDPTAVALSLQVAELRQHQAEMEMTVHRLEDEDDKTYKPRESVKWWDITDESRELEIARLRGFERDVLHPVLGYHMAPCWPLHIPAVLRMELIAETWMVLWLSRRTASVLQKQDDFIIRTLPGLADDIASVCKGCEHLQPKPVTEEVA